MSSHATSAVGSEAAAAICTYIGTARSTQAYIANTGAREQPELQHHWGCIGPIAEVNTYLN